jgi:hypothetical protein
MLTNRNSLIIFSGVVWLCISSFLLILGSNLLLLSTSDAFSSGLLMPYIFSAMGTTTGSLFLLFIALVIGSLKGNFVLSKVVNREVLRIQALPEPCTIRQLYGKKHLILVGLMMTLGIFLKKSGTPLDLRAVIDIAVGSALFQGAVRYFRYAISFRTAKA